MHVRVYLLLRAKGTILRGYSCCQTHYANPGKAEVLRDECDVFLLLYHEPVDITQMATGKMCQNIFTSMPSFRFRKQTRLRRKFWHSP